MKQVVQNYRSGELTVLDVPVPACQPGGVLVRSLYSLISTGTEMMKVSEAQLSLIGKARARPEQVRKVLESAAQQGPVASYRKAMSRLDSFTPLGYSLCGVVVEVGAGCSGFEVGQRVAAAGNEHALHAEYNWVPANLCVPVPAGVRPEHAAFATVGAIALHGVRRAEVALGETACVIGLGLIGQLVVRLLLAAGVRVVGLDPIEERCRIAEKAGALACGAPSGPGLDAVDGVVAAATGGLGVDHVLLTAGGSSNSPVAAAARLARDRATVVDVGKCRLDLPWDSYYAKELDLRFSRSYGPGRYDDRYELEGVDYPAGYVRWTERRNLACFLQLIASEELDVEPFVSGVFPVESAAQVYTRIGSRDLTGVGFLFEYRRDEPDLARTFRSDLQPHRRPEPRVRPHRAGAPVRVGFIGAGNYASSSLLPHLARFSDVQLAAVTTTTPLSAMNAQRRFGFAAWSTDLDAVLDDESIDAVFVVTRHASHAGLVGRALAAGKAVFVEKPLALTAEELDRVAQTVVEVGNDRLLVGFNRRFAPLFTDLKQRFGPATGGVARYLVNAGRLSAGSWYANDRVEGSRFVGEGGHFIDTLSAWHGSNAVEVHAVAVDGTGDLHVTLCFGNGAMGSIAYLASNSARAPKETFDASAGGRTARLDNFTRSTLWSSYRRRTKRTFAGRDKGQQAQLRAFISAVAANDPMPIPVDSLLATTRATLAVERSLSERGAVRL